MVSNASHKRSVKKLTAQNFKMVNLSKFNRLHEILCESERKRLLNNKSDLNQSPSLPDKKIKIEEVSFDTEATSSLFSAKACNVESSLGKLRRTQAPDFYSLDTSTGPSFVSISVIPPSWGSRIKRLNILQLETADMQALNLQGVLLLYVSAGNLETDVWRSVVNNLSVHVLAGICLQIDICVAFSFPRRK